MLAERPDRPAPSLDWAHATLTEVKTVRAALGGTINDVVLAVISRGFRDLLLCTPRGSVDA